MMRMWGIIKTGGGSVAVLLGMLSCGENGQCSDGEKPENSSPGMQPTDVPGAPNTADGSAGGVPEGQEGGLTPFTSNFLWESLVFDSAENFDHIVEQEAEAVAPSAVQLTEVGGSSGLQNAVGGGNQHGVGVAFVDLDNDGFADVFVANGRPPGSAEGFASLFYRNNGDGGFDDVSQASGVTAILSDKDAYSVAAADYDADGDVDLYVTTHPTDILLRNRGDGTFEDATDDAAAGGPESSERAAASGASKIAAWGDFDGDGWMDVVVATSTLEGSFTNGYLLRNRGDGGFEDVTASTGFASAPTGNPCAVLWSDVDNDGDQDLWVWNDRGRPTENRVLLRNDGLREAGAGTWTDITERAGITGSVGNPMGIDSADVNRDGYLDYYVSDIGGNPLYLGGPDGTFSDTQAAAGVGGDFGWGLGFEDLNADSWPDILSPRKITVTT